MDRTTLGRTGLSVSVAGLGCGGPSRLGLKTGHDEDHAVRLVRRAIDAGVNFIDTAAGYGTEPAVGRAVREGGDRDSLVISTKIGLRPADDFADAIDGCLKQLGLDRIDVLHIHGVARSDLARAMGDLVPVLHAARDAGKVRFLAMSERFESEPRHEMATDLFARDDWAGVFDVLMVGFNLLNPTARDLVFPHARRLNLGTLCMFAVRRALTNPQRRAEVLAEIGLPADALDFLGDAAAITDAGYRYCRHEPGVDVVLFGTGNPDHLDANLKSIAAPPLPDDVTRRLEDLFGDAKPVSGS